jgi:hypothetical protein
MGFEISYFPLEGVIENYGKVVSPPAEPSVQEAEPPEL